MARGRHVADCGSGLTELSLCIPGAKKGRLRGFEGIGQPGIRRARSDLGPVPQLPVGAVHAVNAPDSLAFMDHAIIVRAALAGGSEDERARLPQCSSAFLSGAHRQRSWILHREPVATPAGRIARAVPLAYDALAPECARVLEDNRARSVEDAVQRTREPRRRRSIRPPIPTSSR